MPDMKAILVMKESGHMSAERSITLEELSCSTEDLDVYRAILASLTAAYDIHLNDERLILCIQHLLYVLQVNEYINLTSISDISDALTLHILDSLLFTKLCTKDFSSFIDIGTGAGFPGVPFHIATGCPGILLDSINKKIRFNQALIEKLDLSGLSAVHDRVETFSANHAPFDIVLARALAPLPTLIEYAAPLLDRQNELFVSKGNLSSEEFKRGQEVAALCGLELSQRLLFDLPNNSGHRVLLSYTRVGKSKVRLPRTAGMAKRSPLA